MAGQDLNLELIIKARADQAKAEIASTSASVKGLQSEAAAATEVSAARMSAALKSVGGDISKVTPEMLGLGAATAAGAAPAEATAVVVGKLGKNIENAARVSPIAVNEFRALFDEISSGRTYRSPGTIAIIAQKVLGLSTTALVAAGSVAILTAGLGYLGYEALEERKRLDDLEQSFRLTGRAAQFSSQWISYESDFLRSLPGVTTAAANSFQQFVAQHAQIGVQLENEVGQLLPAFIDLYGKQAPEAAGKLALALSDLTESGFRKLDAELLNLNPQEYETILNLIKIGDTAAATQRILDDLSSQSGHYIKSLGDQVYDLEKQITQTKQVIEAEKFFSDPSADIAKLQKLEQALANVREQETRSPKAAGDRKYKSEIDALDKINKKTDERSRLTEQLAASEKTLKDATARGDSAGIGKADQTIAATKAKLAELDARDTKQSYANFEASENAKAAAFKSGSAQRIAILAAEAAKAKALFGTESNEYQQALGRLTQARRQAAEEATRLAKQQTDQARQNLDRQIQDVNAAARQQVDGKRALLQQQVQLGQITSALEIARETQLEDQLFKIARHGFEERLRLETLSPAQRKRINDQIEALEKQHQLKMTELANKSALNVQKQWEHALQPIGQAFDQSIKGMIQGTQSLHQALGGILDSIVAEFVNMGVKNLLHWVAIEAAKTAATSAGAIERVAVTKAAHGTSMAISAITAQKQIFNDALQAASAAFKSTAAIPVVGPILAPVAAAGAFAAVEVFGGQIASARGGYWELPSDQLIMAHEREMVIPSREAEGLRNLINGGGRAQTAPSHTTIQALDAPSLMRLLKRNPNAIAAGVRSAVRNGIIR